LPRNCPSETIAREKNQRPGGMAKCSEVFLRGRREAKLQFPLLRERWPKAFPNRPSEVRALGSEAARAVAEAMGWAHGYARGVLFIWKKREAYCRAVLDHPERIALDGTPCGETVDDKAKALALAALETMRDRRERKLAQTKAAQEAARAADAAARFPPIAPDKTPEPPAAKAEIAPEETPKAMRMRLAAEAKAAKRARQMTLRSHGRPS
jgi:sRNA-binding protein